MTLQNTEAAFSLPYQIILDVAVLVANKLKHSEVPTLRESSIHICIQMPTEEELGLPRPENDKNGEPPKRQFQNIRVDGWELNTSPFFLSTTGKLLVRWIDGTGTAVDVMTYEVLLCLTETETMKDAATELLGILAP